MPSAPEALLLSGDSGDAVALELGDDLDSLWASRGVSLDALEVDAHGTVMHPWEQAARTRDASATPGAARDDVTAEATRWPEALAWPSTAPDATTPPTLPPSVALGTEDTDAAGATLAGSPVTGEGRDDGSLVFDSMDGTLVALGEELGRGGMGVVHLAEQLALKRHVAVKQLRDDVTSATALSALLRESWVSGALEHPNIVPIHALGGRPDAPQLVMKRIEGRSWLDVIRQGRRGPGDVPEDLDRHLQILIQVCHAVAFAHSRGIVHLDLKPSNVMVGEYGEVYLLDWGLAASIRDDRPAWMTHVSEIRAVVGTPVYMAPELAAGQSSKVGVRTDVYLLGAMLHMVLTGRPPHTGATVRATLIEAYRSSRAEFGPHVPAELVRIVHKAMSRDAKRRFPSAEAFRRALEGFSEHRTSTRLSDEALVRFAQLDRLEAEPTPEPPRGRFTIGVDLELAAHDARERRALEVDQLLNECRFGLQQALAIWPRNLTATQGLQAVLERTVERALEQRQWHRAAAALAELPTPAPELSDRVDRLKVTLAREAAEVANLRRLEHAADLSIHGHVRARLCRAGALVWLVWNVLCGHLDRTGVVEFTPRSLVGMVGLYLIAYAVAVYWVRETLLVNSINRRMLGLFGTSLGTAAVLWTVCWILDMTAREAVAVSTCMYVLFNITLAVAIDSRTWWVLLATLPLSLLPALFNAWAFELVGVLGFTMGTLLNLVWRHDGLDPSKRSTWGDERGRSSSQWRQPALRAPETSPDLEA